MPCGLCDRMHYFVGQRGKSFFWFSGGCWRTGAEPETEVRACGRVSRGARADQCTDPCTPTAQRTPEGTGAFFGRPAQEKNELRSGHWSRSGSKSGKIIENHTQTPGCWRQSSRLWDWQDAAHRNALDCATLHGRKIAFQAQKLFHEQSARAMTE